MRVVVESDGDISLRAAQSLSTHPGVVSVALLGPASTSQFPVVDSVAGYDAALGSERVAEQAAAVGVPCVVDNGLRAQPGVWGASPRGLALALAAGMERVERLAVALPGERHGGLPFVFPSPIDSLPARTEHLGGRSLLVAHGAPGLAAVVSVGERSHRMILDDYRFLGGIALAAGVALVDGSPHPRSVWEDAEAYLRTVVEMGLVIGERPA